ncbi:MAG: TIGR02281 family clan AA aspartic protease [Beijerinckiaceae bacterium]
MILLVLFGERESIAGLSPSEFAGLSALVALGIPFAHRLLQDYRGRLAQAVHAVAFWSGAAILFVGLYAYRYELSDVANRILGAIVPGAAITTRSGEIRIARGAGSSFILNGRVNGQTARFIFDTGASAVVLTGEFARTAGYTFTDSDFTIPVSTANGRTTAAPIRINELVIGSISERAVPAMVARPGALRENLLGMSFLERLASYRVEGDQLILRAR